MLPKADSLQRVFGKDVQFIPVTYQSEADVSKLLQRSKAIGNLSLPFVTSDTLLRRYFPHKSLPHYVWIDHGIVKAITDHHAVTAKNIAAMLGESKPKLAEKKDVLVRYNRNEPLLLNNLGIDKNDIHYQTMMCRYIEGLPSRQDVISNDDGSMRITLVNGSISMFARLAYSNGKTFFGNNREILSVKEPELVITTHGDKAYLSNWLRDNTRCYEIIVPASMAANVYTYMQQDLAKLFPQFHITTEKQKRLCLALVRTSNVDKIKSSGKKQSFNFDHFGASITNCSLDLLATELNVIDLQLLSTPVINKTGYTQNVDLKFDATMSNVAELRKALHEYDLDLVEREEEIEVVVIVDGPQSTVDGAR